jgi:hypothetical protein
MISILKSIIAFIISIIALLFCYYYISIPVLPCITVYIISMAFLDDKFSNFRLFLLVLFGIIATLLYGSWSLMAIIHYPDYGNILGIIFLIITTWALIGTSMMHIIIHLSMKHDKR